MTEEVVETSEVQEEVVAETVENPDTLEEVANQVIAGRWGKGLDRKRALINAGYDPHLIQEEINKIYNQ